MRWILLIVLALLVAGCGDDQSLAALAGRYELDVPELAHEQWLRLTQERARELADLSLAERKARLELWRDEVRGRIADLRLTLELRGDGTFQVRWTTGEVGGEQVGAWSRDGDQLRLETQAAQGVLFEGGRPARAQVREGNLRFEGEGVPHPFLLRPVR